MHNKYEKINNIDLCKKTIQRDKTQILPVKEIEEDWALIQKKDYS